MLIINHCKADHYFNKAQDLCKGKRSGEPINEFCELREEKKKGFDSEWRTACGNEERVRNWLKWRKGTAVNFVSVKWWRFRFSIISSILHHSWYLSQPDYRWKSAPGGQRQLSWELQVSQVMWAGLLTLGDIQSYDSLVCHRPTYRSATGDFLIDADFLCVCLIRVALPML